MLTVYGRQSSQNVQKVMWLVAELGLPHTHVPAGGKYGGLDTAEFRARNPHGKVPVIDDGGIVVWESHAILRYLAAAYGGERFWPREPSARTRIDGWMDWAQTALQPDFLGGVFWGFYRTPEAQRNWGAIRQSLARCAAHFELLDSILAGRMSLLEAGFSLADIPAGSLLYRYFTLEIERPSTPNVEAWYRALQEIGRAHV